MNNDAFLAAILERLEPLPVTARPMFGGRGLYLEGKYFGIYNDGVLYFRTDEDSRDDYRSRGMPAFQPKNRPRGPKAVDKNFQVQPDILEDSALLKQWALRAARPNR